MATTCAEILSSTQADLTAPSLAKALDEADPLRELRSEFVLPTNRSIGATIAAQTKPDESCVYLCGNSLGAMPKKSETLVVDELSVWGSRAVEGHFRHPRGRDWLTITDSVHPLLAKIVGPLLHHVALQ